MFTISTCFIAVSIGLFYVMHTLYSVEKTEEFWFLLTVNTTGQTEGWGWPLTYFWHYAHCDWYFLEGGVLPCFVATISQRIQLVITFGESCKQNAAFFSQTKCEIVTWSSNALAIIFVSLMMIHLLILPGLMSM